MLDGILLISKKAGLTSYDVIRQIKPMLPRKHKVGHAGTLDPFATGLLIVMVGRGTKLFDKFQELKKVYRVVGEFGYETDSYDVTGEVTFTDESFGEKVSLEKIESVLSKFRGEIYQTPPNFSAKRVQGQRAYSLAREKKVFQLEPNKINIYKLELEGFDGKKCEVLVECSKGTYIRSLIVDIARELKTFATPVELERIAIGDFKIENSFDIDELDVQRDLIKLEDIKL